MNGKPKYQPPYTTPAIVNLAAQISEVGGRLTVLTATAKAASTASEPSGVRWRLKNTVSEMQTTAILDGKRVIAPPREIQKVRNAITAYDHVEQWRLEVETERLEAHRILMAGLIEEAEVYRRGGVGVMAGGQVIHMAPPAERCPALMHDLFRWLTASEGILSSPVRCFTMSSS